MKKIYLVWRLQSKFGIVQFDFERVQNLMHQPYQISRSRLNYISSMGLELKFQTA